MYLVLLTHTEFTTHRWGTEFAKTNLTFKHLSNTWWYYQYSGWFSQISLENSSSIREALSSIAENETEKREMRNEASGLCAMMDKLETAFMVQFWNTILERFHATSVSTKKWYGPWHSSATSWIIAQVVSLCAIWTLWEECFKYSRCMPVL